MLLSESIISFMNGLNCLFLSLPFLALREAEEPFEVIKLVFLVENLTSHHHLFVCLKGWLVLYRVVSQPFPKGIT